MCKTLVFVQFEAITYQKGTSKMLYADLKSTNPKGQGGFLHTLKGNVQKVQRKKIDMFTQTYTTVVGCSTV